MKKVLTILVSTFALCSLISCTHDENNSSSDNRVRYKVTFLNYDDTFLYETMVFEGKEAKYSGKTPTKNEGESPDFHYEFSGWDPDISCITSDLVTHATFELVIDDDGWGPVNT